MIFGQLKSIQHDEKDLKGLSITNNVNSIINKVQKFVSFDKKKIGNYVYFEKEHSIAGIQRSTALFS